MTRIEKIVLETLRRFQRDDDGIIWSAKMLGEHTGLGEDMAALALVRLVKSGRIIEVPGGEYVVKEAP